MSDQPNDSDAVDVFLRAIGTDVRAVFDGGSVTVLKGSRGRATETASFAESSKRKRQELITQGFLTAKGDELIVVNDIEFDSPSGAATIMLGRASNGWRELEDLRWCAYRRPSECAT